jgi:hypothetical protein
MRTNRLPSKATIINKTRPAGSFSSSYPGGPPCGPVFYVYMSFLSLLHTPPPCPWVHSISACRRLCGRRATTSSGRCSAAPPSTSPSPPASYTTTASASSEVQYVSREMEITKNKKSPEMEITKNKKSPEMEITKNKNP